MRYSVLAALLSLLVSPRATLAQAEITNVGIDASLGFVLNEGFVVVRSSEFRSGRMDFNGDGAAIDFVLHTYDIQSGVLTNTGLDASGAPETFGNYVAWTVNETRQGLTDLNGDGDTRDFVLHVADMSTGLITNLACPGASYSLEGTMLGFLISESAHGGADLNGDGDPFDSVLHLFDVATGTITNVGRDASGGSVVSGAFVAFGVHKGREGNVDLNGDGDASDIVMHVYDMAAGAVTNLELATSALEFDLDGDLLAFTVRENFNGSVDLNGDGDALDPVLHVYEPSTSTLSSLGLAVSSRHDFQVDNGVLAFAASEILQGVDLNSDADMFDEVMHVFDGGTGNVVNLFYAVEGFQLDRGFLVFEVREFQHFARDLNGDGDMDDLVLHLHDVASGLTANLFTDATLGFKLEGGKLLALGGSENRQGGTDQNGDLDTADFTLYVFDFADGSLINLRADPSGGFQTFQLNGNQVSFGVNELAQGPSDLNGDADFTDVVLHYYDVTTGVTTNLAQDVTLGHQFKNGTIAFAVTENRQGMTDLNGDGDAFDVVLHVTTVGEPAVDNGEENGSYKSKKSKKSKRSKKSKKKGKKGRKR